MPTKTSRHAHAQLRTTRKPLMRRPPRSVLIAGTLVALAGIAGTGFTLQSVAAEQAEREAATTLLTQSTGMRVDQLAVHAAVFEDRAASRAELAIATATPVIAAADGAADATALAASVAALGDHESLTTSRIFTLSSEVESGTAEVQAAIAEADRVVAARTPAGAQGIARDMMAAQYGWGADQLGCLVNLWQKESGWRYDALNASSGAAGIPQSLPGTKMATHGADWQTNPATQISWGLDYIERAYGTPCSAWGHSQSNNWY